MPNGKGEECMEIKLNVLSEYAGLEIGGKQFFDSLTSREFGGKFQFRLKKILIFVSENFATLQDVKFSVTKIRIFFNLN